MARFLAIPPARLQPQVLLALLEEFASRDGTDYGERECSLAERVEQLRAGLRSGDMQLLWDSDCEQWDLLEREQAAALLAE